MLVFLALGDAKVLSFALGDAKVPDARYFAFWWNIGLRVSGHHKRRAGQCYGNVLNKLRDRNCSDKHMYNVRG